MRGRFSSRRYTSENREVPQRGLEGRLAISRRYTSGKPEGENRVKSATQTNRKGHRGAGIELSKIVLGLMCPGALSGGGKSQNEAKSRRFGMNLPSRAFYEG